MLGKSILGLAVEMAIFGGCLLLPAPTWQWRRAWVFLGVILVASVATLLTVFRGQPGLLDERFKPPLQKGQPLADKVVLLLFLAAFHGLLVFIPLDVFRLHLLGGPGPLGASLGLALVLAGWLVVALAFRENAFAAPVVRHQAERRHAVVDTGVYGVVRHPLYAGAMLLLAGIPLWLTSWAACLLASVPAGLLLARIAVEERFLRRELPGYEAYMARVRYRLVPYLW
jgi:protein-S-isoprenylcysteine O-methyltransferase Ste14